MTAPDDRDALIAALLAEVTALRARIEALESMDFGSVPAAMPPDESSLEIEPSESWGLNPPAQGRAEP